VLAVRRWPGRVERRQHGAAHQGISGTAA